MVDTNLLIKSTEKHLERDDDFNDPNLIYHLLNKVKEQKEKLDYVDSMGLKFGIMKTSNVPEGFLQHFWTEKSDHQRIFREWCDSMGFKYENEKLKERIEELEKTTQTLYNESCNKTMKIISLKRKKK